MSSKTLKDLTGKWSMNKDLSTDVSPVLQIQGFNSLIIKAVAAAPINLSISQNGDREYHIDQSTTASIPAIKEEWYPADYDWRETKDAFLGRVKSRSKWVKLDALKSEEGFLTDGLSGEDEVVFAEVESLESEWNAVQVWRMEDGRFIRRVVTKGQKGPKKAETKLVYDPK